MALPDNTAIGAAVQPGSSTGRSRVDLLYSILISLRDEIALRLESLKVGIANGICPLDSGGKVATGYLPAIGVGQLTTPGSFYGKSRGGALSDASNVINLDIIGQGAASTPLGHSVIVQAAGGALYRLDLERIMAFAPPITKGADFTLALSDRCSMLVCTKATAQAVTVPTNASVPIPVGTTFMLKRSGAGTLTVSGSVTIDKPTDRSLTARAVKSVIGLHKEDTDLWTAFGDLT